MDILARQRGRPRYGLAMSLLLALGAPGMAEPCNPVIDGTYCATNSSGRPGYSRQPQFDTLRGIGNDIVTADQPATLGAITFHGSGTKCMGLFRRGNCY